MPTRRATVGGRGLLAATLVVFGAVMSSCSTGSSRPVVGPCRQDYEVVEAVIRPDPGFTQGFTFLDGVAYESVGLVGSSALRRLSRPSFAVDRSVALAADDFAEGLTALAGRLYQLTWKGQVGYVWTPDLVQSSSFRYSGEGWGLTTDGTSLIRSDGTDRLVWMDPSSFADFREVKVADENGPVNLLNELEWVDGVVFANVWKTDVIVVIDPKSGRVLAQLDLALLRPESTLDDPEAVLNGVAYEPSTGTLLVTGKRWPEVLSLELGDRCWR